MNIKELVQSQRDFFAENETKKVSFRLAMLKKLRRLIKANEKNLFEAIYEDFGKSEHETYMSELSLIYHELNGFIKNTAKWSSKIHVSTNISNVPGSSYIIPEPLGVTLVIGAWNYPYQLSFIPAITALAAGNTVILKPSELPGRTSAIMAKMINENFPSSYIHVVEGGVNETTELLEQAYDKIFFTGSTPVGKIVYQAAAKHLTPVTLELGGKSPTFVLADCNMKMTVRRMVWSKFLNAGQTCVAPDYVLVESSVKDKFLEAFRKEMEAQYDLKGSLPNNYLKIINDRHFERLTGLIDKEKIYCGGEVEPEKRIIHPTILHNIDFDDRVMEDEIFGPILPVIAFDDLDKVISEVKKRPKPLSCYVFGKNKKRIRKVLHEISFGGGAVNESVMHLTNPNMPFGGVGQSGMGNYHGKFGFRAFSHYKGVLEKPNWYEAPIKYAPYTKLKMKILRFLLE